MHTPMSESGKSLWIQLGVGSQPVSESSQVTPIIMDTYDTRTSQVTPITMDTHWITMHDTRMSQVTPFTMDTPCMIPEGVR